VKQVFIQRGRVLVREVPAPMVGDRNILVRVSHSCVSVGTEMAGVRGSSQSIYRRVLRHPDKLRQAMELVREHGLIKVAGMARDRSNTSLETGYSAAGTVIAVGRDVDGFKVGDRVACGGAGVSNHAEIIDVPCNLAVAIPSRLGEDTAATVALGAIALQGVRRTSPALGETIVVVGLGFLGQLTAQLLRASGCHVIGVDLDSERIRIALENGMDAGVDPAMGSYVQRVHELTAGFGADAAIVTAAGGSNQIISDAMQACRKKGRVVLVGDVGLSLNRTDMYQKELDFLISTSYGPGRYDAAYESGGQDYPLPYVRWTENRNMEEYLRMLAEGRISLKQIPSRQFSVDLAPAAYEALKSEQGRPLLVYLAYPERPEPVKHRMAITTSPSRSGVIRVAVIGAGAFAQGTHLPNLAALSSQFALRAIVGSSGARAATVAAKFGAEYVTTDVEEVLADPSVDLLLVSTRHNLHASMTLRGLQAGKHVFVEKPLATSVEQLRQIDEFYKGREIAPVLMTGFNRRFSPAMKAAKAALANRATPLMVSYRMNAGYIPPDSWVHGQEGGGRNIGEACHIYDLFCFLVDADIKDVCVSAIRPRTKRWVENDNFVATVAFVDGSVCSLTYTAMGHASHSKEQMECYADGRVVSMDNFTSLTVHAARTGRVRSRRPEKGHLEELQALASCIANGTAWPIPLHHQLQATAISLEIERQISETGASPAWPDIPNGSGTAT